MNASRQKEKEPVGLIGMGLVGSALAQRFLQAGYAVIGCDIDAARGREMEAVGVRLVDSPADVARNIRRIVLSLPDSSAVEQVIFGVSGLAEVDLHEALIVDTTTGDPEKVDALVLRLAEVHCAYVEACILGSSRQVREGDAVVAAGGAEGDLERCRDLLAAFAHEVFHMGPAGKGSQAKLVANLVLGLNRLVLSEGLVLAETLHLELRAMLEFLKSGAAYSRVMDTKGEKMRLGDYRTEARLAQHLKDVNLILLLGERAGAPLSLTSLHKQILEAGMSLGMGDLDNSAVFEILRRKAKGFTPDEA